jgi:anti-anti-sigma factor
MSDHTPKRFRIVTERDVRVIEITIPDDLESLEFDSINTALADAVTDAGAAKWVLDLTAVSYAGSALLGLLVNLRTKVRRSRGTLAICCMDAQIERVLRTGSMDRLFIITATRDEAIAAL